MKQQTCEETFSALQPPLRPPEFVGFDLEASRRPGVPMMREPQQWPNTRYPPQRQEARVPVFMHGRPHKDFPPVFGTDAPPHGLSGLIRKAAYAYPDHVTRHWLMLLFADRVDSMERRVSKLAKIGLPLLAGFAVARTVLKDD